MGCHFLCQGIFLTQGLNLHLQHCRWILYWASCQGSPSCYFIHTALYLFVPYLYLAPSLPSPTDNHHFVLQICESAAFVFRHLFFYVFCLPTLASSPPHPMQLGGGSENSPSLATYCACFFCIHRRRNTVIFLHCSQLPLIPFVLP